MAVWLDWLSDCLSESEREIYHAHLSELNTIYQEVKLLKHFWTIIAELFVLHNIASRCIRFVSTPFLLNTTTSSNKTLHSDTIDWFRTRSTSSFANAPNAPIQII